MTEEKKGIFGAIEKIKPKYIWWVITIALIITVLFPPTFPVKVEEYTQKVYDYVEGLSGDDVVILGVDHTSAAWGEVYPLTLVVVRQLVSHNVKLVFLSFQHYEANALTSTYLDLLDLEEEWGYSYGVDYVNIGYLTGGPVAFDTFAGDFQAIGKDVHGTSLSDIALTEDLATAEDFTAVFCLGGSGYWPWIQYWVVPYDTILICPSQGLYIADIHAYYITGQIYSYLASTRGGAELEYLTGFAGRATMMLASQNMAHFVLIALVVLGNIALASKLLRKES